LKFYKIYPNIEKARLFFYLGILIEEFGEEVTFLLIDDFSRKHTITFEWNEMSFFVNELIP